MTYDVIVIGGGASGMMAAINAGMSGARVLLLERNEKLGKKIYITGKGRCNVTNIADRESFFRNIMRNPRFMYAAYSKFDNNALMELIEANGTRLKTERGGRVFPISDKSSDITRALENALKKAGAEVRLNTGVRELIIREGAVCGVVTDTGAELEARSVIIATGGLSYQSTGSTGDGLRFAKDTGHNVTRCLPSLVPIETEETWPFALSGLSLRNVTLTAKSNGKEIYSDMGEMLFTHFGITGPLVLSCSAVLPEEPRGTKLFIDLKPALSPETLDDRLVRDIREQPRASVSTIIDGLMPRALASSLINAFRIDGAKHASELKASERRQLVSLIKAVPLTVRSIRGFNEAVITRGGVSVKDINPSTMESKKIKGLFFAGEVIDIDALTGGFNLQLAFSTGALAGRMSAAGTEK